VSSQRQIEANRLNAQKSTGPRTPHGKQRVASNALKHGLTGKQVVMSNENPADFDEFRSALFSDLDPQGALEELLADKIVADAWRVRRVPVLEAALHARGESDLRVERLTSIIGQIRQRANIFLRMAENERAHVEAKDQKELQRVRAQLDQENANGKEPMFEVTRVLEIHLREFDNLLRHEQALTKSMLRGLHELERLQMRRAGEPVAPPAVVDVDVHVERNGGDAS